ncbi:MAG: ABC transporter ATP-binding protein [Thermogemmatispora sp.]|uniref:ABC transporter ATP-binding protein n=1 Tax=Thermogemmatispora sp. TaxID=1968838 RepID=UPI0026182088|nr:ABC transporter ATP-binding protein [Thermogemmatispora sp.]MBX5456729.1 ABC transporter ATP-binding protein [Thermogemmatispora sp.]
MQTAVTDEHRLSQPEQSTVEPVIQVENLVKCYKKAQRNAVDGVSFSVPAGSLFALLGPNGAGKTTVISILTTTLSPTAGRVRIAGYDLEREAAHIRRQIGIVFQKPSLDQNLTAEENVRLHVALYGLYPYRPAFRLMPAAYRQQVEALAELLDISESLFKPVKTFSGGMKRKLEILRGLLHRPAVLFLDEPTTGLDPESRHSLWDYLRRVRATGQTTIFLTTHYLEEVEEADAVCIMSRGKIAASGTPEQLKASLTQARLLLDAPERARLRQELQQLGVPFQEGTVFELPVAGPQVQYLLKRLETPLSLVQTHAPSLEEAYLHIIGRQTLDSEEE